MTHPSPNPAAQGQQTASAREIRCGECGVIVPQPPDVDDDAVEPAVCDEHPDAVHVPASEFEPTPDERKKGMRYVVRRFVGPAEREYECDASLVDTVLGVIVYTDGGEPEDNSLHRDLRPLVDLLNERSREIAAAERRGMERAVAVVDAMVTANSEYIGRMSAGEIASGERLMTEAIAAGGALTDAINEIRAAIAAGPKS